MSLRMVSTLTSSRSAASCSDSSRSVLLGAATAVLDVLIPTQAGQPRHMDTISTTFREVYRSAELVAVTGGPFTDPDYRLDQDPPPGTRPAARCSVGAGEALPRRVPPVGPDLWLRS